MRRFGLRIELRSLMIMIAVAALLLGAGVEAVRLKARSSAYRARAAEYASKEVRFAGAIKHEIKMADELDRCDRASAEEAERQSGVDRLILISEAALLRTQAINLKNRIVQHQAKEEWYATMKARYQFASSHPWLSIPPGPPEPR